MESLETQVGGDHYKKMPYQPVQFSSDMGFNFIQGCIVKYLARHKFKNGKQDLEKAIHFATLGESLKPASLSTSLQEHAPEVVLENVMMFCSLNNLDDEVSNIISVLVHQRWLDVVILTRKYLENQYPEIPQENAHES